MKINQHFPLHDYLLHIVILTLIFRNIYNVAANKPDLDNFDGVEEGEGEGDEDQEEGEDCQDVGDHARALLAH